jgi:phosphoribosylaminoimidazole (AIR) synthetase
MRLFGALGGMDEAELRATFNGGIGMVVVVPPDAVPATVAAFAPRDVEAALIGEVVETGALDAARYVEAPLEALA